jgi:predicted lactoylglutathione lyase
MFPIMNDLASGAHRHFTISLPVADRVRSRDFYRDGLGLDPIGPLADDGVPEPLQFMLDDGVALMLVPTDGFGFVIGRNVADEGVSECLLSASFGNRAEVDEAVERAVNAGAHLVTPPGDQPWGYCAMFTDPDGHAWMYETNAPTDS